MVESVGVLIHNIFNDNVVLATFIISLIPLIELKGAIPFGMSVEFWGINVLTEAQSFAVSFLGGVIVTVVLVLVFLPIYNFVKNKKMFQKVVNFFTYNVGKSFNKNINENKKFIVKFFAIVVFVAVPFPATGVYSGACLAMFLGLGVFWSIIAVILGNFIAGVIVMTICAIVPNFSTIIFFVFLLLIVLIVLYKGFSYLIFVKKNNDGKNINI